MTRSAAKAKRLIETAGLVSLVALVPGSRPASGAALPQGCDLGYGGQTIAAPSGRTETFSFQGYNAVPPSHHVIDARISWGDGKTTPVAGRRRSAPFANGCYVTNFTARHTYPPVPSCRQTVCTKTYDVTIRYRDSHTHASLTLHQLRVIVGRTRGA